MNEIKVFENEQFGNLRTVSRDGEVWFVGKDVAQALGYANTKDAILHHVDPDDRSIIQSIDFPQRSQNTTFEIPPRGLTVINESGLYSLILSSKLPSARQFRRWVTHDVLPAIRRTGAYATPDALTAALQDPEAIATLLTQLSQERTARIAAESSASSLSTQLSQAQSRISNLSKPGPTRFLIHASEMDAENVISMSDLAVSVAPDRHHPVSRTRLFRVLRENGYIRTDSPLPTTLAIREGYLVIVQHQSGNSTYYTSGATVAGQLFFFCLDYFP